MFLHIALVAEVLATIVCIHCIYGKKVECDVKTVTAFIGILLFLEGINYYQLGGLFSVLGYAVLFFYCKSKFNSSVSETLISILLYVIVLVTVQLICVSVMNLIIPDRYLLRNSIVNILLLLISKSILPNCGLHKLQKCIFRKSRIVIYVVGFMCIIVMMVLLQEKVIYEIQMEYFVLVIPAIIMLLYLILKWYTEQIKVERVESEILRTEENSKNYGELLTNVRLRQHEFKNHMAAVFSAHYVYNTYDKLVQAQNEYCNKLIQENRYNNLLMLDNSVLVGFLYGKFQDAEADGVQIDYAISGKVDKCAVPVYHIVEMIGILLDNAVEALKDSDEKTIFFEIRESEAAYEISVKNPFRYVSYDEMSEWFQLERSDKGYERGLGLYHLKCMCENWKCNIVCRNEEINQMNWIVFSLKARKADNE